MEHDKINNANFEDIFKNFEHIFGGKPGMFSQQDVKRHKAYSTPENYRLEFAVPGFERSEIDVILENDILTLTAVVEREEETFWKKSFTNQFKIPNDGDNDGVKAKLEQGLLVVTITKNAKLQKRSVTID